MSYIQVEEAIARLCKEGRVLTGIETLALGDCLGRTLAQDLIAPINVPPADNSAMDGYALASEDWVNAESSLEISQRITAGSPPQALTPGTAARIFTGAEIPPGADIVVMQEKCSSDGQSVKIDAIGTPGANIRRLGQDINSGDTVLTAGWRLRAQDLGLVASLGFASIKVFQRLKVAIVSTGEELVEPGTAVKPGQIYNSNRYMLDGLIKSWDMQTVDLGIIGDDPALISDALREASEQADVIVTSGGVSVGEEDHVKAVVESLGSIDLWRVAIKPGKPFAFGQVCGTPFLGLPGNPVSALVTMLIIARPFLLQSQGLAQNEAKAIRQVALFDQKVDSRQVYLRVRMTENGAELFSQQSSGVLFSTIWGDGLAVQKPGQAISKGDSINVIPFAFLGR